jgi:hypothetical protein
MKRSTPVLLALTTVMVLAAGPLLTVAANPSAWEASQVLVYNTGSPFAVALTTGGVTVRSDDASRGKYLFMPAQAINGTANAGLASFSSGTVAVVAGSGATLGDLHASGALLVASVGLALDATGPVIISGPGDPTAVRSGAKGSLYLRTDGGASTSLYVNETGDTTGWVAK